MNNQRRKKIQAAIKIIEKGVEELNLCLSEEESCYDNLSEGLQCTSMGEEMSDCIDIMSDAIDGIEDQLEEIKAIL